MARVFLSGTEKYVEVPDSSVTLADICFVLEVDPTSAYIKKTESGAVVATFLHDCLPEFSGTIEYTLCAALVSSASKNNNSINNGKTSNNKSGQQSNNQDQELQFAVLRMAQLVDSLNSGSNGSSSSSSAANTNINPLLTATEEELEAVESFFKSDNNNENSSSSTVLENKNHAMFVSFQEHYHPESLSKVLEAIGSKKKGQLIGAKYSFGNEGV